MSLDRSNNVDMSQFSDDDLQQIFQNVQKEIFTFYKDPEFIGYVDKVVPFEDYQLAAIKSCETSEKIVMAFRNSLLDLDDELIRKINLKYAAQLNSILYEKENRFKIIDQLLKNLTCKYFDLTLKALAIKDKLKNNRQNERRVYTKTSTPQLKLSRAIAGHADCFIKTIETRNTPIEKKLIVNIPQLVEVMGLEKVEAVLATLKAKELELYMIKNGKIVPYTTLDKIELVTTKEIRKIINDQHKNIQDYYILDYVEWDKLLKTYHPFKEVKLYRMHSIELNESKIMLNINKTDYFKGIRYFFESLGDKHLDLRIISSKDVKKAGAVLQKYANIENLVITNDSSEITKIQDNDEYPLIIPGNLKNLKSLVIKHDVCNQINFADLPALTYLEINCEKLTTLDLRSLPALSIIRIKDHFNIEKILMRPEQHHKLFIDISSLSTINYKGMLTIKALQKSNVKYQLDEFWENDVESLDEKAVNEQLTPQIPYNTLPTPYDDKPKGLTQTTNAKYVEMTQTISLNGAEGDIDPRDYRKTVFTGMEISPTNELVFTPFKFKEAKSEVVDLDEILKLPSEKFTHDNVKNLNMLVPGSFYGVATLSIENPQWVPLTGLSVRDNLTVLDSTCLEELEKQGLKCEVRYATETQQYFVRIVGVENSNQIKQEKPVKLYYGMCPNKEIKEEKIPPFRMPSDIKKAIDSLLSQKDKLAIHIDKENPVKSLYDFGHAFKKKDITPQQEQQIRTWLESLEIKNESITKFFSVLYYQAGVCEHRSKLVMALANCLNIPARVCENDVHAYVEYFTQGQWHAMDLGGGDVHKMHTINSWEETQKEKESQRNEEKALNECIQLSEPKKLDPQELSEEKKEDHENKFENTFSIKEIVLDEEKGFANWYSELLKLPGHPLLQSKQPIDIYNLHSQLMTLPGNRFGENYFYIHSPADFDRLIKQLQVKQGECCEIKGPLLNMLEIGQGTILINWSTFTEKQIANYKSVLDTTPTLQGYKLASEVKIISVSEPNTEACAAFYSRTKNVAWPNKLTDSPEYEKPFLLNDEEAKAVDLYKSCDWESFLVGKFQIRGNAYTYVDGELLKAIKSGKDRICLTGLPHNKSFKLFLERLQRERGFYANGEWHRLPDNFKLYSSKEPSIKPTIPLYDTQEISRENIFYINKQNYYQYFERVTINKEGHITEIPGLLANMPNNAKLVMTDHLNDGEIRRLQDEMKKAHSGINLMLLPHLVASEQNKQLSNKAPLSNTDTKINSSTVIFSNDYDAAAREIQTPTDKVMHISNKTELSDLFENITLLDSKRSKSTFGKRNLRFNYETFELFTHLEAGGRVILKGDISSELYHELESLFAKPPYMIINGEYKPIKGNIVLVTPQPKDDNTHLFASAAVQYQHTFDWAKTPPYIMRKINNTLAENEKISIQETKEIVDKIQQFYERVKDIKHDGITTPPDLILTEDRVLQLAMAIKRNSGKSNPVKSLFHQSYTENKENYAYLSIMEKIHLSDTKDNYDVDKVKLHHLLLKHEGTLNTIKKQIIDCFSPMYLKNHYDELLNSDLTKEQLNTLIQPLNAKPVSVIPRAVRQSRKVFDILKHSPYIELRGTPGTGKTHFIEHELKNKNAYWSEDKIIAWLTGKLGSPPHYLLLDEANMKEPGYWDFLKGLENGEIYYKGKSYQVSSETHKIIFTGNPENYPGRHHHSLLHQVPKVYFKSHTDDYLHNTIIAPFLDTNTNHLSRLTKDEISRSIIAAFHLAKQALPFEIIGLRDIKAILECFLSLQPITDTNALNYACLACIETFSGLLKNADQRTHYINSLNTQFNITEAIPYEPLPSYKSGYILPSSRQLLWNNVNHCLLRRECAIKNDSPASRVGLLVEGPSGIGKSEMMLQALKTQGFSAYDEKIPYKPNDKIYFHITMGSDNIYDVILKAYQLRAVVIIDELNLLTPKDDALLNDLLEGRIPSKGKEPSPGFCVLASQNSQLYGGRKPLSHALLNRLNRFYEFPYTKEDLCEIATNSGKFSTDKLVHNFVDRFLLQQAAHPDKINVRNFFLEMNDLPDLPSAASHRLSIFNKNVNTGVPVATSDVALNKSNPSHDN